jgi:hypothetical protein
LTIILAKASKFKVIFNPFNLNERPTNANISYSI